jgi:hypothetical protein
MEKKYNAKESLLPVLKLRYNAQLFKSMLLTDVMIKIPLLMKLFSTKRALPGWHCNEALTLVTNSLLHYISFPIIWRQRISKLFKSRACVYLFFGKV